MNDREQLIEERRELEQMQYVVNSVQQAEVAGECLARFCLTFLQAMEGQGMVSEDTLRLLLAAVGAGYGR